MEEDRNWMCTCCSFRRCLSFPMTNKADFLFQCGQIWSAHDITTYQDRTFLSVLQLVFAIGAVHAHLIGTDDLESPRCSSVSTYEGQILVVAKTAKHTVRKQLAWLRHHNQCDESDDEASLVSSSRTNSFSILGAPPDVDPLELFSDWLRNASTYRAKYYNASAVHHTLNVNGFKICRTVWVEAGIEGSSFGEA